MSESRVESYLRALAAACAEVIRNPKLLPVLIGVLRLAPQTLLELQRGGLRRAA
jgi:hypothetical protein